jgi:cytochrome c-type biogenesis protein CcmE
MTDRTTTAATDLDEGGNSWIKFLIGGVVIVAALALLLYTTTQGNAQYLVTVEELRAREAEMVGKDIRVSGVVVPDSIAYDATTLHLEFDIVDQAGASQDPLRIVMDGEPLPDQMQNEAEAIAEGRLHSNGTFQSETLMMKCASKYDVEVTE